MRHFISLPFAQRPLPSSVAASAAKRLLVAMSGPAHRLATPLGRTSRGAVLIASIALQADQDLSPTT
jgi:hypothetical protein